MGRLLTALENLDLADKTVVVLTADHGDFMGDYGMVRKGMFLYESLLHVPLVWWGPGPGRTGGPPASGDAGTILRPVFLRSLKSPTGNRPRRSREPRSRRPWYRIEPMLDAPRSSPRRPTVT